MTRRLAAACALLPILLGACVASAEAKPTRRIGETPPNVVAVDRAGVKRRLRILKSYPESLFDKDPRHYISRIVFVPDGSGRLRRMVVRSGYPGPTTEAKHFTERMVGDALFMLFDAAPHRFPRGSELYQVELRGSTLRLSLNRAFAQADFWRNEVRGRAVLYAIVNTALEHAPYVDANRVQILVEGKTVARLGALKTDKPLAPRMSLVFGP